MGLKNPFRRDRNRAEMEALHGMHSPWWAWGPLGLIWYGGHSDHTNVDAGNVHNMGDGGNFHNPIDPGAGMGGGFDGGGGGGF